MHYQKIINLIENTPNQPSKFRKKHWLEVNDESRGTYSVNSQNKFKTSMLKSILYDNSNAYILVSAILAVPNTSAAGVAAKNRKNIIIKNCALFTNCIREINNMQIDNTTDNDIVMSMYTSIAYNDNNLKHLEVYGITTEMKHF